MDTKRDIAKREDIEIFLKAFYTNVIADKNIGRIFTEIVPINWDHHIPLIADFWESILLDNPVYKKNAMEVHYKLNQLFPLQQSHFDSWLSIFNNTLDGMFEGEKVMLAKKRAHAIATLMAFNMNNASKTKSHL